MKKLLFIFTMILGMGLFHPVSAHESKKGDSSIEEPCSVRYEVFVNGEFAGYHTEYNYSLSCSGQESGVMDIRVVPILA